MHLLAPGPAFTWPTHVDQANAGNRLWQLLQDRHLLISDQNLCLVFHLFHFLHDSQHLFTNTVLVVTLWELEKFGLYHPTFKSPFLLFLFQKLLFLQ